MQCSLLRNVNERSIQQVNEKLVSVSQKEWLLYHLDATFQFIVSFYICIVFLLYNTYFKGKPFGSWYTMPHYVAQLILHLNCTYLFNRWLLICSSILWLQHAIPYTLCICWQKMNLVVPKKPFEPTYIVQ